MNLRYRVDTWRELNKVQALAQLPEELKMAITDYVDFIIGQSRVGIDKDQKVLIESHGFSTHHEISW